MWIGEKKHKMRKWYLTKVWVEWKENPEDELRLSLIPLRSFIDGVRARLHNPLFTYQFRLVPPWEIKFTE